MIFGFRCSNNRTMHSDYTDKPLNHVQLSYYVSCLAVDRMLTQ